MERLRNIGPLALLFAALLLVALIPFLREMPVVSAHTNLADESLPSVCTANHTQEGPEWTLHVAVLDDQVGPAFLEPGYCGVLLNFSHPLPSHLNSQVVHMNNGCVIDLRAYADSLITIDNASISDVITYRYQIYLRFAHPEFMSEDNTPIVTIS